jgi:urease accessory protein
VAGGRRLTARRRRALGAVALVGVLALLVPVPVHAHSGVDMGDFYAGLTQPVFHWELLLLALAAALWSSQAEDPDNVRLPVAFLIATAVGAAAGLWGPAVGPSFWPVRLGALLLGLLVAIRLRLSKVAIVVAALGGLTYGWVAAVGEAPDIAKPIPYALGLVAGVFVLFGWVLAFTDRFRAFWVDVAVRVVGSWIATISLLVSALDLAKPPT